MGQAAPCKKIPPVNSAAIPPAVPEKIPQNGNNVLKGY